MPPKPMSRPAVETVLLAGDSLDKIMALSGQLREFTEWQLTVAAWKLDKLQFGLTDHEDLYPDHKRVYCELIRGRLGPIGTGYIERRRPNWYAMTPKGTAMAVAIRHKEFPEWLKDYKDVSKLMAAVPFLQWCSEPSKPHDLNTARLGLLGSLKETQRFVTKIIKRMVELQIKYLTTVGNGFVAGEGMISFTDVALLLDFLTAMEGRFPQLSEVATCRKS